jgi:hypothetical protein
MQRLEAVSTCFFIVDDCLGTSEGGTGQVQSDSWPDVGLAVWPNVQSVV